MHPLHDKVTNLLKDCLCAIRRHACGPSQPSELRLRTAEYLLTEAQEYIDAACNLLEAGKPRASLAVSRWVLEAALNLLWATVEPAEVDDRLRLLVAEAFRFEAARLDGQAELYPDNAKRLRCNAEAARQQMRSLALEGGRHLESLDMRVKSLWKQLDAKALPSPYTLYRVCCDAAHPGLALWRRFRLGPGGAAVASEPPESLPPPPWMLAASALYLAMGAYRLAGLGDANALKTWWDEEVAPLLSHLGT